ncbi:MAG: YggS family pyridoxal phosphate-dependent enzyme [Gammaproteobacteria bacterium]
MTSIAENLADLHSLIRDFERRYKRPENSVRLLAVSKRQSAESIRAAHATGQVDFGENYLQEATEKQQQLFDLPNLAWHFIGPIQSNKTRGIATSFQWVHGIDRGKIAQRLNDHRGNELPPLNCCIQVNLSGEESKSGVGIRDVTPLCELITKLDRLKLRGLMAIPAPLADFDSQRDCFRELAECYGQLQSKYPGMDTLSMGMSDDFEAAIAAGATMIRLGTAVFGPRL